MTQVKAKEKEMKAEKEEERQVSAGNLCVQDHDLTTQTAKGPSHQGEAS